MIKLNFILLLVSLILALSGTAQLSAPLSPAPKEKSDKSSLSKTTFIEKQNYLSKSTLSDYRPVNSDSLKGFDELSLKTKLLNSGLYGSEYHDHIHYMKHKFIKEKYYTSSALPPPLARLLDKIISKLFLAAPHPSILLPLIPHPQTPTQPLIYLPADPIV